MTENNPAAGGSACEFVAFRIGAQEFCIDIMSVREIRGWTPATPLPHAPSYVRGVINLRGSVLPIVDLAERLGFPPIEATVRQVIIVVQFAGQIIGLLVDAVSDILTQSTENIQPTPDIATDVVKSFVRGVLAIEGRMIGLVELDSLMSAPAEKAA
ncbi:MAG: chemotaxis protein CheW [Roseiarcus sp.]|jgi:purine-binding chemotaxis protein CheW